MEHKAAHGTRVAHSPASWHQSFPGTSDGFGPGHHGCVSSAALWVGGGVWAVTGHGFGFPGA